MSKKKWDYVKMKSFCTTKETINRKTRRPTEGEKILTSHISDKGSVSKVYRGLVTRQKEPSNQMIKWAGALNRCFSKEDIPMANRYMKRYSASLTIREIHNEPSPRTCYNGYCQKDERDAGEDAEEREPRAWLVGV